MKKKFDFTEKLRYIGTIIWSVAEFPAIPVLLVVIGLRNSFSWRYYVIAAGGYSVLLIIAGLVTNFISKMLGRKSHVDNEKSDNFFDKD